MIDFRCWFCGKRYVVADDRRGQRQTCSCGRGVKVPKRSGGRSRAWTVTDFVVETVVYGGGGAVLGFGLGALVASRLPIPVGKPTKYIVGGCTLAGFLLGAVGGEPAVNWVGRLLRDREDARRLG